MTSHLLLTKLLPCVLLGTALLTSPAQAQLSGGSQSQLRPPNGAPIAPRTTLAPQLKNEGLTVQANTAKPHKMVQVDLPVTDFGLLGPQKEAQMMVAVRNKYIDVMAGDLSNASVPKLTVPDIKFSGPQAASFAAGVPECGGSFGTDPNSGSANTVWVITCLTVVTFRPAAYGEHTALLVASFPDGDRFKGQLKGMHLQKPVTMPLPGNNMGSGLRRQP
nr:hypothetical protein [Rhodoferax sp.]